jgi:hypothetical protein
VRTRTRAVRKSQLLQDLVAYLTAHPQAQDTLEGIVAWWVPEQELQRQTAAVKAALTELVAKGVVLERRGRDARLHYRLNPERAADLARLRKGGSRRERNRTGIASRKEVSKGE